MKNVEIFFELAKSDKTLANRISDLNKKIKQTRYKDDYELVTKEVLPLAKEYEIEFTADEFVNYARSSVDKLEHEDMLNVSGGNGTRSAVVGILAAAALLAAPTIMEALSESGIGFSLSAAAMESDKDETDGEAVGFMHKLYPQLYMSKEEKGLVDNLIAELQGNHVNCDSENIFKHISNYIKANSELQVDEHLVHVAVLRFAESCNLDFVNRTKVANDTSQRLRNACLELAKDQINKMLLSISEGQNSQDVARDFEAGKLCSPLVVNVFKEWLSRRQKPSPESIPDFLVPLYAPKLGEWPDGGKGMSVGDFASDVLVPWLNRRDEWFKRLETMCTTALDGAQGDIGIELQVCLDGIQRARTTEGLLTPTRFFELFVPIFEISVNVANDVVLEADATVGQVNAAYGSYNAVDRSKSWSECVSHVLTKLKTIRFNVLGMTDSDAQKALKDDIQWICSKMWEKNGTFYLWTRLPTLKIDTYGEEVYTENAEPGFENHVLELLKALNEANYDRSDARVNECLDKVQKDSL